MKLVLRIFFPLFFCFLSWKFFFPLYRVVPPFCVFTDWFFNSKERDRLHMVLLAKWFIRKLKIRKGINFIWFFLQNNHKKLEIRNELAWHLHIVLVKIIYHMSFADKVDNNFFDCTVYGWLPLRGLFSQSKSLPTTTSIRRRLSHKIFIFLFTLYLLLELLIEESTNFLIPHLIISNLYCKKYISFTA